LGDDIRLDGKVAIVTGGGRGLGRAMALALAEAGARVVAVDQVAENLARVEREAASLALSGALAGVAADIRKAPDCRRAIDAAHERFGGLDILVNNAGVLPAYAWPGRFLDGAPPGKFWNLDDDVVRNVIDTNYDASRQDARPDRVARLARDGRHQRHALRCGGMGRRPPRRRAGGVARPAARLRIETEGERRRTRSA